ncbi:MAG: hypothetical protein AVDCRST_MAG38-2456, partial [uncultured Solirubrobacteraceae bacterium]
YGPARSSEEETWREVHTGDAAVRVIAGARADAAAALRRLRPLDGRIAPLAPPARRCG